jgi:hypothetical protein
VPGPTVRNTPRGLERTRKRGRVLGTGRSHTVPAATTSPALRRQDHVARAAHAERVRTIQQPSESYRSAQTRLRSLNQSLNDLYAETASSLTKLSPLGTITPSHSDILSDPRYKQLSKIYHRIAQHPQHTKALVDNAAERGLIDEKPHDFIARVGDLLPEKPVDFALLAAPAGRLRKVGEVGGEAVAAGAEAGATRASRVGTVLGRAQGRATEAVPQGVRKAAGTAGRTVKKGWASKPAKVVRTGTRVTTAPVRVPTRYLGKHPLQSFGASSGAVGAVAAAQSGNPADLALAPARVVGTTATTAFHHPGDVALTTLRTVPSMATAAIKLPGDVGAAVLGHPDALKGLAQSQIEYLKQIEAVAQNKNYTTTYKDAHGVTHKQTLTPSELIQHNLGAVPLISEGLIASRILRGRGITGEALSHTRLKRSGRIERLQRDLNSPDHEVRQRAEKKLGGMRATFRQRHGQRVRESQRKAATDQRARAKFNRELRRSGRGKERLDRQLERLNRERVHIATREHEGQQIHFNVSKGDIVQAIGRTGAHGLKTDAEIKAWARQTRAGLKDVASDKTLDPNAVATREVLDTIEQHPSVVRDPDVQRYLSDHGRFQYLRSVERHSERTGVKQTTPDPEDLRAQWMHLARAEGVHLPEERVPPELAGKTGVAPKRGQDMEKAIRDEAAQATKKAQALRRKAKSHDEKARGHVRELKVRRVADARRTTTRSLDRGLTKLEERHAAWKRRLEGNKAASGDVGGGVSSAYRAELGAAIKQMEEKVRQGGTAKQRAMLERMKADYASQPERVPQWKVDENALKGVAASMGIREPIRIKVESDLHGAPEGATASHQHLGAGKGHEITLHGGYDAAETSQNLYHELEHAAQVERRQRAEADPNFDAHAADQAFWANKTADYQNRPDEVGARDAQARHEVTPLVKEVGDGLSVLRPRREVRGVSEGSRRTQQRQAAEKKVADLERQIRDRKARLAMSASPTRLRTVGRITETRRRAADLRREADAHDARAAELRSVVNRKRRAVALERQGLLAEIAGDTSEAARLRGEAVNLRRAHNKSQGQLRRDFHQEAQAAARRAGKAEPIYFKESDAAQTVDALNVLEPVFVEASMPKKERHAHWHPC